MRGRINPYRRYIVKMQGSTTCKMRSHINRKNPTTTTINSILGKVRVARKSNVLKLGYFTRLTIISERNTIITGKM